MKVEHVALWALDIERLSLFYREFFGAQAGLRYINERTGFESYFLTFSDGARLEVMQRPDIQQLRRDDPKQEQIGYAHIAMAVGSTEAVDELTKRIVDAGHRLLSGPRYTGDGYYESVILDPEGNQVEVTA